MRPIFVLALLTMFLFASPDTVRADTPGETDMSAFTILDGEARFLTIPQLDEMANALRRQVREGQCVDAMPAILEIQDAANRVANLVRQGIEPFYRASRDDQVSITRAQGQQFNTFTAAERTSNRMLQMRNEFWVLEAECLLSAGDTEGAVNRFFRALRFIDGRSEPALWERARGPLWEYVGFTPD
jgi:hypothetical protein